MDAVIGKAEIFTKPPTTFWRLDITWIIHFIVSISDLTEADVMKATADDDDVPRHLLQFGLLYERNLAIGPGGE